MRITGEGLGLNFEKLMVFGDVGPVNENENIVCQVWGGLCGGPKISEWKDVPVELLLGILSLVDDPTVIVASGVCHGWRDAFSWGITYLSLSWCKKNTNNLVLSLVLKFTKLQVLTLRQDSPQLQDVAVETITSYCIDLQELDLSKSFRLTDRSLYALAGGCPNLVKLKQVAVRLSATLLWHICPDFAEN